jgi:uncharacterized protein DUF397
MCDPSKLMWQRSSLCSAATCVEVARLGSQVFVRDSKIDESPVLAFQQAEWADFLEGIRRGEFDLPGREP